jgi:hypothetical protein
MPDVQALNEVWKIWGMGGVAAFTFFIIMRYMVTWLRDVLAKSDERHEKTRADFLTALELQRKEHSDSMEKALEKFDAMHSRLDDKVDGLSARVDVLTGKIK